MTEVDLKRTVWAACLQSEMVKACEEIARRHKVTIKPGTFTYARDGESLTLRFKVARDEGKTQTVEKFFAGSIRICNLLEMGGIFTVSQLISKTADDLMKIRGCGPNTLVEIRGRLAEMDLSLKGDDTSSV